MKVVTFPVNARARNQGGFTLLEVLIALLVLAVGLLGFAMLQVVNVRYTESANYRTKATQLADTLLDQVRADRKSVAAYATTYTGTADASACALATGTMTAATFKTLWQCQLGRALGADASATVTQTPSGDATTLTVSISWTDDRGNAASTGQQVFSTSTTL